MIFLGEPNLRVNTYVIKRFPAFKRTLKHLFKFDSNGEYKTDSPEMIKKLTGKFPVKEEGYQCKKCEFIGANKGLLMAHYRAEHPKEE